MISIMLLVVLVALAVGSPVFAQDEEAFIALTPAAACPGERVTVTPIITTITFVTTDFDIAAVSPSLDDGIVTMVLSSDPVGLITNQVCSDRDFPWQCTFVVGESASCGHYTVTVARSTDEASSSQLIIGSGVFDVAGPCCAVGGCVQPVNTFALLSPWLAAIGLVGCISTVALVTKKRRQ